MDGVSEDPEEPSIGSRDPLQMRVSIAKLLLVLSGRVALDIVH